jgi:hypothetical protein
MFEQGASFTQIAFVSNDWRKSAKQWIDVMSAGPFFILKLPPLKKTYRGRMVCDTFEAAISLSAVPRSKSCTPAGRPRLLRGSTKPWTRQVSGIYLVSQGDFESFAT